MSSGYTRQSAAEIIPSAVVKSSSFNAELNKLRDAFDFSTDGTTGHTHDGSSDEGSYVPLIADVDGNNKAVVSTTNNRIEFFVSVSDSPVEQVRLQDGAIVPVTTNDVDLGASAAKFKDLHLAGDATVGGTVTSTGGFIGDVTGAITGGVTGNVTGNLTGNVTASSGSSTFENVTINGTIDVTNTPIVNVSDPTLAQHAATKAYVDAADNLKLNLSGGTMSGAIAMGTSKITGLGNPTLAQDAATKNYVDTQVSGLVDAAPGALDTLNELAAALGDDPNFATTVTDSIATKLSLAGGTMSGAINMGTTNKITALATPTAGADATTKTYVDTADALKVAKAGDSMTGALAMGSNKITGLGTPTTGTDATTKAYVDGILGSATAASDSADAAALSASNAATSYDQFDDRYLGSKTSDPSVDNDGDALLTGALYWNSVGDQLKIYDGAAWNDAAFDLSGLDPDVLTLSLPANTTISTFGASLVDDVDAATARTTLGGVETTTELNARDTANRSRTNHTGTQAQSTVVDLVSDLAAKAPLASPAFTGTPTAPTPTAGDNSTKVATTAYVDATAGGGGFEFIATTDIPASTFSVDFTGFDATKYDAYLFVMQNITGSSDGFNIEIRTSSDGGSTFDSGASDYQYQTQSQYGTSLSRQGDDTLDHIKMVVTLAQIGNATNEDASFNLWVIAPHLAKYTRMHWHGAHSTTAGEAALITGGGFRAAASDVDAIRFIPSIGSFSSGSITMYGVKNA